MSSDNTLGIQRGNYAWTLPGPLLLILGRLACIPLQSAIISHSPFHTPPPTADSLDLSFWPSTLPGPPEPVTVFLGMTAVLVVKQAIWAFYISNEAMSLGLALFGALADFMYEGICALVFSVAAANPMWRPAFLYVGAAVHLAAALLELGAELQRKSFKDDARNAGRLCTTGLWGVVRHPNFAMNVVYGAAYGLATGGPLFIALPMAMYLGNFVTNAIPPKELYMKSKYGEQWEKYRRVVRWKLCPGVY